MTRVASITALLLSACLGGSPDSELPTDPSVVDEAPAKPSEPAPLEPPEPSEEPSEQPEASDRPGEPETFTAATRESAEGKCTLTVSALLEAAEYRGPGPITPALEASLAANPEFARSYQQHSHGDHHIQCVYLVELAHEPGKRYRWQTHVTNTTREATPKICNGMAGEVADDILRTTKDCTALDAGAYWGFVLEAVN